MKRKYWIQRCRPSVALVVLVALLLSACAAPDRVVNEDFPTIAASTPTATTATAAATPAPLPSATPTEVPTPTPTTPPPEPVALLQGQFTNIDDQHEGRGTATLYQLPDGSRLLRFEDFFVTNGPDVHVLLDDNPTLASSADLTNAVEVGLLKGNVGNQNYEIPADLDLSQVQSVVLYCEQYDVLMTLATLE